MMTCMQIKRSRRVVLALLNSTLTILINLLKTLGHNKFEVNEEKKNKKQKTCRSKWISKFPKDLPLIYKTEIYYHCWLAPSNFEKLPGAISFSVLVHAHNVTSHVYYTHSNALFFLNKLVSDQSSVAGDTQTQVLESVSGSIRTSEHFFWSLSNLWPSFWCLTVICTSSMQVWMWRTAL